ncbi:hypothetical protein H6P81_015939 [Aristolochia fimbriata]|uniref:Reverse transcriptase Ty1/copia-type domain-containing protein n=1 Tax=Aristolochia fimbriata TaxID=158543 RepID=A0AAV7E7K0_ARIFI|nr:hypothetical protein H6P81_015939 [Aristolochia fimbriata]
MRLILAVASSLKIKLQQMDVKSAFLNGYLAEEVYVEQPKGFIDPHQPNHVYCLTKALYDMQEEFEMSMVGEFSYFLGFQIKQSNDGIFVSQEKYAKNLVKKFGLEDAKDMRTPMSTTDHIGKDNDGTPIDPTLYRTASFWHSGGLELSGKHVFTMGMASSSARSEDTSTADIQGTRTETHSLSPLLSPTGEKVSVDGDSLLRPLDPPDSGALAESPSKDLNLIKPLSERRLSADDDDMSLRQFLEKLVNKNGTVRTSANSQVPASVMLPSSTKITTGVAQDLEDDNDGPLIISRRRKLRVSEEEMLDRKSRLRDTTRWKRQRGMRPADSPICLDDEEIAADDVMQS